MLKFLQKKLAIMGAALLLAFVPVMALAPATVSAEADIRKCLGQGSDLNAALDDGCDDSGVSSGADQIQRIVTTIVNIFSIIVGIVAVIMIIWGGFKYITSGGDSGNITSAKNTIIYAILGLVIVALAQFLVQFVLERVVNA